MTAAKAPLPTSDPPLSTLTLPHGPLAFTDEGPRDAPAVVMVHGIPGSVRDFRYLAPQLSDLRVVRVDLPGFGGSAAQDDAVDTLPGRARAVIALADHLGLARFTVVGHSMGGGTALAVADAFAARLAAVVLIASVGLRLHRGLGLTPGVFAWLARAVRAPLSGPLLVPLLRWQYRRRRFPDVDAMDAPTLALQLRSLAATDFGFLRAAVGRLALPAVVAYAPDDHMVETGIARELAASIPIARVLAFESGGHNLQKTRALELGQAIRVLASGQSR